MMRLLQETKIAAFAVVLILLLLGAAYVYLVQPAQEEKAALSRQLDERRKVLAALEGRETPKEDPAAVVRLAQVRRQIPDLPYPELLLRELRMLELVADVKMRYYSIQIGGQALSAAQSGFSPLKREAATSAASGEESGGLSAEERSTLEQFGDAVYPVTVSVEFSGGYVQIRRLLEEVETMERIWHVSAMTLNAEGQLEQVAVNVPNRQMRCQLTFRTYYAPLLQQFFPQPLPIGHEEPGNRNVPF
ncbi:MAG TPA: hypothetical protein VIL22_01520 [Paenibacillaceae bacterium]